MDASIYQCASCKSENTFAPKDLFHKENYDFLPIFGPEDGVIFRRKATLNKDYKTVRKGLDWFRKYFPAEYMVLLD